MTTTAMIRKIHTAKPSGPALTSVSSGVGVVHERDDQQVEHAPSVPLPAQGAGVGIPAKRSSSGSVLSTVDSTSS